MSFSVNKHPSESFCSLIKTALPILAVAGLTIVGIRLASGYKGNTGMDDFHREIRLLMDTTVEIVLPAGNPAEAGVLNRVFSEMERLETRFSRNLEGSEISNLNEQAGQGPVRVGADTIDMLQQARNIFDLSEGAFDPAVAPLLDLWGFSNKTYRVPLKNEIETLLPLVDYALVEIDRPRREVSFLAEKVSLDLGGIAKGYIVDRGVDLLRQGGVNHGFIDAGGDIGIAGPRPDGKPWRIAVRHPRQEGKILAVIPLSSGAVATSGDYERMFEQGGQRYHHILDPDTGYPASGLTSATVIAPNATEADALSTAVFVLGPGPGLELVESLPGVEAILVTPRLEIIISSGLKGKIELPDY